LKIAKVLASLALSSSLSLGLSGCGGGGGDTSPSVPTASAAPPSAPPTGGGGTAQPPVAAPPPVNATVGTGEYGGRLRITAQNAVPASPAAGAPTPILPTTSAGVVHATPVNQVVTLNRTTDGLSYYGFSDGGGTYVIPVADLQKICVNGPQTGLSINGQTSRACGNPDLATNTVTLPGTCSKDRVFYTAFFVSAPGVPKYFDWTSARKFTRTGLPSVLLENNAEVNWGNYQGATIKVVKAEAGKASVTVDFGSNCVGSFGQTNNVEGTSGRLVDMSIIEGSTWLRFMFHSNKSGANGTSGWGSEPWLDVPSGYTVQPSILDAYLNFNESTGNYFVTIPNVPCSNAGNITAYRGTRQQSGAYTYDAGISGTDDPRRRPFGLGWLPIQANATESQLYTLISDPSVATSLDRTNYNLVIGSCS